MLMRAQIRHAKWKTGPAFMSNHISPNAKLILAPKNFSSIDSYLNDMLKRWSRIGGQLGVQKYFYKTAEVYFSPK